MILKHAVHFIVLLLLQAMVLNHVFIGAYIYPAFYIYFILLLPFETKGWVLLFSSFFLGLGVDFFTNSLGINAAASVFMAFFRPMIIRLLSVSKETEPGAAPGLKTNGFAWFFIYALILIFLHHSMLFILEVFGFANFFQTLYRIIFSTIATLVLVLLAQLIFFKHDKR
jgi:hypothetical protein